MCQIQSALGTSFKLNHCLFTEPRKKTIAFHETFCHPSLCTEPNGGCRRWVYTSSTDTFLLGSKTEFSGRKVEVKTMNYHHVRIRQTWVQKYRYFNPVFLRNRTWGSNLLPHRNKTFDISRLIYIARDKVTSVGSNQLTVLM